LGLSRVVWDSTSDLGVVYIVSDEATGLNKITEN
jgi:hypothetical protein